VKKARYVFAAAGVAPTLGLLAPAAAAVPVITHAQARPAKTVRLSHPTTLAHYGTPTPQNTCHPGTFSGAPSGVHQEFLFEIYNYGHCVDSQRALLETGSGGGLSERIRAYSEHGKLIFDRRILGTVINKSYTVYPNSDFSSLNWNGVYEICAALVVKNTNSGLYGPVCLHP
jgi:hypothetical protein